MAADDSLFRSYNFPLYCLFVVWPPASWTQAIHVVLDVIEAELANLYEQTKRLGQPETERISELRGKGKSRTWYPQGHGRKFRSDRSNSSIHRGLLLTIFVSLCKDWWCLTRPPLGREQNAAGASRNLGRTEGEQTYQTSSSSSMKES